MLGKQKFLIENFYQKLETKLETCCILIILKLILLKN
jgi:hypothetical protein